MDCEEVRHGVQHQDDWWFCDSSNFDSIESSQLFRVATTVAALALSTLAALLGRVCRKEDP